MIKAAEDGVLSIEKLEAMTCVCSVGLDMIAIPGDTTVEAIAGIIADEAAIGMINTKTTAVRVIPAIGKVAGDTLHLAVCSAKHPSCRSTPMPERCSRIAEDVFPHPSTRSRTSCPFAPRRHA